MSKEVGDTHTEQSTTKSEIPENMKRKILVIDDEPGIRDLFSYFLQPHNIEVTTAADGIEGLGKLKDDAFDLVFLDVHMPKMRGPEVLKEIKKIKPKQVVIIFSSSSDPAYVFESNAKRLGAFECLFKPFLIDDIMGIMEKGFAQANSANS